MKPFEDQIRALEQNPAFAPDEVKKQMAIEAARSAMEDIKKQVAAGQMTWDSQVHGGSIDEYFAAQIAQSEAELKALEAQSPQQKAERERLRLRRLLEARTAIEDAMDEALENSDAISNPTFRLKLEKALMDKGFSREYLNREDDIIPMRILTRKALRSITQREMKGLVNRMKTDEDLEIVYDEEVLGFIARFRYPPYIVTGKQIGRAHV